jgi:hypothetical protein
MSTVHHAAAVSNTTIPSTTTVTVTCPPGYASEPPF